ncbi:hypothetical protein ACG7TL_006699 [Trametes sanguinea]
MGMHYDKTATEHRLRRMKTPVEAQKSQKAAELKSKQDALKELQTGDPVYVEAFGFYSTSANKSHAISKNCHRLAFTSSTSMETVFDKVLKAIRELYEGVPPASRGTLPLHPEDFIAANTVFSIAKGQRGAAGGFHISVHAASLQSIGEYLKHLQTERHITQTDGKDRMIRMNSSAQPKAPAYVSAFCAPPLPSSRPEAYETFKIRHVLCVVSNDGVPHFVEKTEMEEILIGRGWQHFKGEEKPRGGWLGGGGSKYAFEMAPLGKYNAASQDNVAHLRDELKLLAQYFAESFQARSAAHGIDLSEIIRLRFNHEGAFMGQLANSWELAMDFADDNNNEDNRALIHDTFLATRLIPKADGYTEVKFSGAHETGRNTTAVGRAIDTFAHHVLVDSNYTCVLVDLQGFVKGKEVILFDPQAHTRDWATGPTGYWDKGATEIEKFRAEHQCNALCRSLGLVSADKRPQGKKKQQSKNPMAVQNLVTNASAALRRPKRRFDEVFDVDGSSPSSTSSGMGFSGE